MISLRTSKNHYRYWIQRDLKAFWSAHAQAMPFDEFLTTCCFFVTVTFDQGLVAASKRRLNRSMKSSEIEMQDFDWIVRWFFGAAGRMPNSRPLIIAASDDEDSKFGGYKPATGRNVHVHSIWAIRPEDVGMFEQLASANNFLRSLVLPGNSHVDSFEYRRPTLKEANKATDYMLKRWIKGMKDPSSQDALRFYEGQRPKFRFNQYKPNGRIRPPMKPDMIAKQAREDAVVFEPWELPLED